MSRARDPEERANLLDRAIAYVHPRAGLRRARARAWTGVLQLQARRYEAAALTRRTTGWIATGTSANAEIGPALDRLRNRSRDLVRNSTWAGKAVRVINARTIGTGIKAKARTGSDARNENVQGLWKDWADTTDVDPEGSADFWGIQGQAMRALVESGECLIRRRRRRVSDRLAVPLQLQILEPDHIDTTKDQRLNNGGKIIHGVEYSPLGRRVAYWLFPEHPGENNIAARFPESRRVLARDLLHLKRIDRPGQVRGVPWGAPVALGVRIMEDFWDATLERGRIAACFAGFVTDINAEESDIPTGEKESDVFEKERIEPGTMGILPAGKEVRFSTPPEAEGLKEFSTLSLQSIAAGFGVTYEALSTDLKGVSFSGGRMGWLEFYAEVAQWRWLTFIPQICRPVWRWFVEAGGLMGAPGFSTGERIPAMWTPPKRDFVDPLKEGLALADQVRAGLISLSEALRSQGFDPEEMLGELSSDVEVLRRLGLSVTTVTVPGMAPAPTAGGPAGGVPGGAPGDEVVDEEGEPVVDEEGEPVAAGAASGNGRA